MMEKMMVLMMGSGDGGDDVDGDGGDDICFSFTKTTRWKAATRSTSGNEQSKEYTCDNETTKDGYARCAVCISPVLREVEGVLWPLKARTHGSILVDT